MIKNSTAEIKTIFLWLIICFILLPGFASEQSLKSFIVGTFKNGKTKETSMWEVISVPYPSYDQSVMLDFPGLKRDDGLILVGISQNREFIETFLCKGEFGEFNFYATRWDTVNNKPTNKYIVFTKLFSNEWSQNKVSNDRLIVKHAKDIRDALLHYPSKRIFNNQSVQEVWFDLNFPSDGSHLVRAEEI